MTDNVVLMIIIWLSGTMLIRCVVNQMELFFQLELVSKFKNVKDAPAFCVSNIKTVTALINVYHIKKLFSIVVNMSSQNNAPYPKLGLGILIMDL